VETCVGCGIMSELQCSVSKYMLPDFFIMIILKET
jgi:hypothetical protein